MDWLPHDPLDAARALLGAVLTHVDEDGVAVAVRICETEAYAGPRDPASHAFRGPTPRNAVMFGPAGRLYVYRSHGLHWCCNVTTGDGQAGAVLLRAGEVVDGVAVARERRRSAAGAVPPDVRLARGPGNLGQALGLHGEHDGAPLDGTPCPGRGGVLLEPPASPLPPGAVTAGPRVGVSWAADLPWRLWVAGHPAVSAYRRSPRAPRPR